MCSADRAITVFSADGQLLQVQYAFEAVRKGSSVVGVRGTDTIVIATEKRAVPLLQEGRIEQKMAKLDKHVMLAFSGLRADARVLISRARIECQAYQLTVEDSVSVEYITKFIGGLQQLYTQSIGRRPFGVSCIIGGFDSQDGQPHLFQTEPSGITYEWTATATGRNDCAIRSFLEKNYSSSITSTEDGCIRLALQALLEVAPKGQTMNFDVAVIKPGCISVMAKSEVSSFINIIKKHKNALNLSPVDNRKQSILKGHKHKNK